MAPASSTASASSSATSKHSLSASGSLAPTAVTTVVDVTPSHSILTTTITTGGSASLPTLGAVAQRHSSDVPVAAIAGGAAAGVVLALVAVVGWTWWGRCIKRQKAKERKETLAFLEVRENTRRNASTLSFPATQHRPAFTIRGHHSRKVKFASSAPYSSQSTLQGNSEKKGVADAEKSVPTPPTPRPPTPSAQLKGEPRKRESEVPPPLPRKNPRREHPPVSWTAPTDVPSVQHRLTHQASTVSAASQYSTQSAVEERPSGVPSSLLLALTNEGNRRSLLAGYLPWNRYRTSVASNNRLSEYSTGSGYSQFDDQPWEPVGCAYGGEDELPRR
ncbi:hypothetical protein L226DRAFT_608740 [Lentinus tigrinus ALCF2SS1-7]|uniref:Uncharacterized protein n=1 Tax=Lentinus tigrinus ALCF2SS1-6 TaxID=1328759 RepID=A0A5C2SPR0_9APHY|nr:hypothetical protein L227DRAFT_648625 [Lentinus tigrinus ALCF2SS1-6]RPD79721.1 hypothetical protein L226DRAFT_608740 [Lentinus tigrinus ALCF2SS1-7]